MIDSLKQKEKEIQEKIKAWEDYEASNNKYYKIPNPNEIDGHYSRTEVTKPSVPDYKEKLKYLKIISEYYDKYDYIVDIDSIFRHGLNEDYIRKAQITQETRDSLHKLIEVIEARIINIESNIENK